MDLTQLRSEIDQIDDELVRLFAARMDVAAKIADYKKFHGLPILDAAREQEKLQDIAAKADPALAADIHELYSLLFSLSRRHQQKHNASCSDQR